MLLTKDEDKQERLFGEPIGCAIVDSGCTTLCVVIYGLTLT